MSAPLKNGLDYFPCECNFDDNVELVIAEFGVKGLGILIRLWQKIYSSEGYYCQWNDDVALMFAHKNNVSVNAVSEIINACLRRGLFDCGMYEHCGILTSRGIQKRYFEATKRRERKNINDGYLLIGEHKNADNVNNNSVNVCNNSKIVCNNSQRKGNKSKVKESKVKVEKLPHGQFGNVLLTDSEYNSIKEQNLTEYIESLSSYIASTGKKYKSHYATILNWARCDGDKKNKEKKNRLKSEPSFDIKELQNKAKFNEDYDI